MTLAWIVLGCMLALAAVLGTLLTLMELEMRRLEKDFEERLKR